MAVRAWIGNTYILSRDPFQFHIHGAFQASQISGVGLHNLWKSEMCLHIHLGRVWIMASNGFNTLIALRMGLSDPSQWSLIDRQTSYEVSVIFYVSFCRVKLGIVNKLYVEAVTLYLR